VLLRQRLLATNYAVEVCVHERRHHVDVELLAHEDVAQAQQVRVLAEQLEQLGLPQHASGTALVAKWLLELLDRDADAAAVFA